MHAHAGTHTDPHRHTHRIDIRDSFCEKWALRMGKKKIIRPGRGMQFRGGWSSVLLEMKRRGECSERQRVPWKAVWYNHIYRQFYMWVNVKHIFCFYLLFIRKLISIHFGVAIIYIYIIYIYIYIYLTGKRTPRAMCTIWWHFDVKDEICLCVCVCVYADICVWKCIWVYMCLCV